MFIYKATNLINGKIYIGKTVNSLKKRITQHKSDALSRNSQMVIHRAIRKYGWDNFRWEIIDELRDNEELCKRESYWISHYNSTQPSIGYNSTDSGEGVTGLRHSNESKNKISESRKGKANGEKHHMSKLTKKDVVEIKVLLLQGKSQRSIAKKFNVSRNTVTFIQKGKTWTDVEVEGFTPFDKSNKGEGNHFAKLTEEDVKEIKNLLIQGVKSQSEIANMFNVSKHIISKIKLGKIWNHVNVEGEDKLENSFKTMSSEDVFEIKKLIKNGLSLRKISSIVGFNRESIRKIKIKIEKGEI